MKYFFILLLGLLPAFAGGLRTVGGTTSASGGSATNALLTAAATQFTTNGYKVTLITGAQVTNVLHYGSQTNFYATNWVWWGTNAAGLRVEEWLGNSGFSRMLRQFRTDGGRSNIMYFGDNAADEEGWGALYHLIRSSGDGNPDPTDRARFGNDEYVWDTKETARLFSTQQGAQPNMFFYRIGGSVATTPWYIFGSNNFATELHGTTITSISNFHAQAGLAASGPFVRSPAKTVNASIAVTGTNFFTIAANTNFTLTLTGTPTSGQLLSLVVSNFAVATDIIMTNVAGIFDFSVRSNRTLITIPSNSVSMFGLRYLTNFVAAGAWYFEQQQERTLGLEPGSNIAFTTNGANGTVTIDSTGGGAGGGTNTALFVQTNDVSVANTVTETTMLGSGVGSKTLPANYFIPGRNIRGLLRGTFSDDAITPGTVRVRVKLGSTTVLDTTAQTPASAVTDDYIEIAFDITCRLTGASGAVWGQGYADLSDGLVTTHHILQMVNSAPVVIDTTASQVLDVTWQWGTADSDNSMTNHMAIISEGPGVTAGALTDGDKGDITVSSSGTIFTIDNTAVTDAKLRNSGGASVIGRQLNSSGAPADIQAPADNLYLKRTNSVVLFGAIPDTDLPTALAGKSLTTSTTTTEATSDNDTSLASTAFVKAVAVASNWLGKAELVQDSITIPMGAWFTNNLLGAHPSGASSLSFSNVSDSFEFSSVNTVTNGIRLLCALPISWDAGVIRMGIRALCVNTNDPSATNVVWGVRAAAIKSGEDATSPTYGTSIAVTNPIAKQANTVGVCFTRDITVGNTPAATNMISFEISRLTADTGDTLTNSGLRMIETVIYYKRTSNATWPVPSL